MEKLRANMIVFRYQLRHIGRGDVYKRQVENCVNEITFSYLLFQHII